ncbi:MAG TPA: serine hydrolase, partial [Cytophagales bacterium]|nr:serine hydrolase [Cytophagales bacterium]
MKQWTFLFACLLSLFCSAYAQDLEPTLDAWLTAKYPAEGPGAAALVARGGEVLYHKAFGMANLELDVPMRTDMVFRIASISKQFTAICILMLAERGQLSLDDDLIEYLPDYPTEGQHISLRHLLTHTSGISRSFTLNPWDANIRRHDFSPKEFIDYFKIEPKSFAPGEYYQYNNFGYFLLGHIVELVSGMSYGDFVAQNIFEPLGMTNSYEAHDTDLVKNRAYGYEFYGTYENKTYVSPSQALGAGSLMSTVEDLHRWYRGLLSGKLVSQESLDLAFTNHIRNDGEKINYGFGWFINEINGSPTVEHAGGDHGFRVDALYLPDEEVFVAVFSNCSCGEPRPLSTKIAALAIGKPYTEPT